MNDDIIDLEKVVEPMTPKRFSLIVERIVREKELNYMDAILHYCEEHQLEPEDIRKYVSRTLKEKVEVTAQELNYLPKTAVLPI